MDADQRRLVLDQLTEKIIGGVFQVSNALGSGFLEKVYENALALDLRQLGFSLSQQHRIEVRYKGVVVGDFVADLLVEESVIVEIKAVRALDDVHTAQCLNYLKATGLQVCLLVNFGSPKAIVKRVVNGF
jgi:GxxExxY protein